MLHLRSALLSATLFIACGEAETIDAGPGPNDAGIPDVGGGDVGPNDSGVIAPVDGDPFDPAARATQLAQAICAHRAGCEPLSASYSGENEAQCTQREAALLRARWDAYPPLITRRRAAFVASRLDACLATYQAALADCDLGPDLSLCDGIFLGSRPTGTSCGDSVECQAGLWCTGLAPGCGLCIPKAAVGDSCLAAPCVDGARCLSAGVDDAVCVRDRAALGASCGDANTGLCRGHLQCVGAPGGALACARPAASGAICDVSGAAPNCDLPSGYSCADTDRCEPATIVAPPAACGTSAPSNLCDRSSYCATASGQCEARAAAAEACDALISCAPGLRCIPDAAGSPAGRCRAPLATGATCTSPLECAPTETCLAGRCGALRIDATCG
ncbi:MAG: hypothetical protein IPG45_01395 [Deltaproteobacteria bacterium]|nr:hypothetical protein [Deltaproteobacteria bacterium]